jgi:predicted metal-dependent phosphoesterase TrpH
VTLDQIRGHLYCHTTDSDRRNTLAEMAEASQARGYEYLAICDHSKRVAMAHGLDAKRLAQPIKLRQLVVLRGLNFTGVFTQFRLDIGQADLRIDFRFRGTAHLASAFEDADSAAGPSPAHYQQCEL